MYLSTEPELQAAAVKTRRAGMSTSIGLCSRSSQSFAKILTPLNCVHGIYHVVTIWFWRK
jgi:hypothetical protein